MRDPQLRVQSSVTRNHPGPAAASDWKPGPSLVSAALQDGVTRPSRRRAIVVLPTLAAAAAMALKPRTAAADTTLQGPVTVQGTLTVTDLITAQNGVKVNAGTVQLATYPVVGGMSAPIIFPSPTASWRIFLTSIKDQTNNTDEVFTVAYNITRNNQTGQWNQPDVQTEPVSVFTFQSSYNGYAVWNWDLAAPGAGLSQGRHPWSAAYTYASGDCAFDIGGVLLSPPGSGGVRVNGGPVTGQLLVRSATGQAPSSPLMRLTRADGTTFTKAHPQAALWVLTGSTGADVNGVAWNGLMHIVSTPQAFSIGGTSPSDIALQSLIEVVGGSANDSNSRFILNTDGTMQWGPGNGAPDTRLYRSAPGVLSTNGSLAVNQVVSNLPGGGRISQGSGAPSTPNGIAPAAGDIYFRTDTPKTNNHRIYICIAGGSSPGWSGIA